MRQRHLLPLLLCPTLLSAQGLFQRVIDCNVGYAMALDASGTNTYMAYEMIDEDFGYHYGVGVVKYDAAQQLLWSNVYTAPPVDVNLRLEDMVATADGGVVFAGVRNAVLSDTAQVVKIGAAGQVLWSLGLPPYAPSGASGSNARVNSVAEAPNGDVLVAGQYTYYLAGDGHQCAFLARISAAGAVQWTRSYTSSVDPETSNRALHVQALAGGGIGLLGYTGTDGGWLARLQDDGTVTWSKRYSTTDGFDVLFPMHAFPTGTGFDIFLATDLYSGDLACVMHTNATGDLQSSTLYHLPVGLGEMLGATALPDGRFAIASVTNLTGEYEGGNAHLLVLGADHEPTLSTSFGSSEHEYAYATVPTSDGGYLVAGGAAYADLAEHRGGTASRPYLVKTDAQGTYLCGDPVDVTTRDTALTSIARTLVVEAISGWVATPVEGTAWSNAVTVCAATGVAETAEAPFTVAPNPADASLVVTPADAAPWTHTLLDATGRAVRAPVRATGRVPFDVDGLAPGRYLLRSTSGDRLRSTPVMVVH